VAEHEAYVRKDSANWANLPMDNCADISYLKEIFLTSRGEGGGSIPIGLYWGPPVDPTAWHAEGLIKDPDITDTSKSFIH